MGASWIMQVDQVPLAFGLDWVPLLGDEAMAASIARRHGATHLVLSGSPAAALGLARGLRHRGECWSAADLMARQHPAGTVVLLLELEARRWHVLASHEGVALARADRSYPDRGLAYEAIEALRLSHPQLELLEDTGAPAEAAPAGLRRLALAADGATPLRSVSRNLHRLPWFLAVLLPLAIMAGRGWLDDARAGDEHVLARQAWDQALGRALGRQAVHGIQGTRDLLGALYRQPAVVAGWVLQSVRCEGGPSGVAWRCLSEYRRGHPAADNRGLLQAAPADWQLDFPSLDRVQASWPLALTGAPAGHDALPSGPMLSRDWASALQEILPAFASLQLEAPRPLAIVPPRNADGDEIPRPEGFPRLATRVLRIHGPLQSASLVAPLAQSVSWQKLVLTHTPGTQPGLRSGRLTLQLEGLIHESA